MVMNFKGVKVEQQNEVTYESISKYMATDLITFGDEMEIGEAIDIMIKKKISGGPVLNSKKELVGVLSEKDCLKLLIVGSYHNIPSGKSLVKDYMSTEVRTLDINIDIVDCANEFINSHFRRFPITENGVLKGQVSRRDILRAAQKMR